MKKTNCNAKKANIFTFFLRGDYFFLKMTNNNVIGRNIVHLIIVHAKDSSPINKSISPFAAASFARLFLCPKERLFGSFIIMFLYKF